MIQGTYKGVRPVIVRLDVLKVVRRLEGVVVPVQSAQPARKEALFEHHIRASRISRI